MDTFSQVIGLRGRDPADVIEHVFQCQTDAKPLAGADALARLDTLTAQATALSEASEGCQGWTGAERNGALRRMDRLAGVLATLRSAVVLAEQHATEPVVGDRDFAATHARMTRTGLGEARREVRRAETLAALPAVTQAVKAGNVPCPTSTPSPGSARVRVCRPRRRSPGPMSRTPWCAGPAGTR